jgi:hypothetical protein
MLPQLGEYGVGQCFTRCMPPPGAQVVLSRLNLRAMARGNRFQNLESLGDDLRSDAVTGDHSDVEAPHHAVNRNGSRKSLSAGCGKTPD